MDETGLSCASNTESEYEIDEDALAMHMLAREGETLRIPLVSLIWVGNSDSIWGTMAGSLYQRHSLGIEGLVFGILVDEDNGTARVLYGWLEDEKRSVMVAVFLFLLAIAITELD